MNWLTDALNRLWRSILKRWFPEPQPDPLPTDIEPGMRRGAWDRYPIDSWPVTIPLHSASIHYIGGAQAYEVRVSYDHLQTLPKWYQDPDPDGYNDNNVNGAIHLLRKYEGEWVFASIDYLRVGQMEKRFAVLPKYLIEYQPGEPIGVMVSTTAREWDGTRVDGDPRSPYRERSNITWTEWPL